MDPGKIFKIITFFAIPIFGSLVAWVNNYQLMTGAESPFNDDIGIYTFKVKSDNEHLFVVANKSSPYKFMLGQKVYKGLCVNRYPSAKWGMQDELIIRCNGGGQGLVFESSYRLDIY